MKGEFISIDTLREIQKLKKQNRILNRIRKKAIKRIKEGISCDYGDICLKDSMDLLNILEGCEKY